MVKQEYVTEGSWIELYTSIIWVSNSKNYHMACVIVLSRQTAAIQKSPIKEKHTRSYKAE